MKKLILFIVFFILLTCIIFGTYLYICRASFSSAVMTKTLATRVTIGAIDLGARSVVVENVEISNPPGCIFPNAFTVDAVRVNLNWKELAFGIIGYFNDSIKVDKIEINHPQISVELFNSIGTDNNWKRLMSNLPPQTGSKNRQSARTFVIKEIEFTDITIDAKNRAAGNVPITVPKISRLKITPSPHGERRTAEELARMVLVALTIEIGKQMQLNQFSKELQKLYGIPPELIQDNPTIQSWFNEAQEKVKNLFDSN